MEYCEIMENLAHTACMRRVETQARIYDQVFDTIINGRRAQSPPYSQSDRGVTRGVDGVNPAVSADAATKPSCELATQPAAFSLDAVAVAIRADHDDVLAREYLLLQDTRNRCWSCGVDTHLSGKCSLCQEGYDQQRIQK
ncbi:MAG: hypothetical protein ACYDB1_01115 [Acidiferrobacteraceae bacterium]